MVNLMRIELNVAICITVSFALELKVFYFCTLEFTMSKLITVLVILSILSGVAFCRRPFSKEQSRAISAAINSVCKRESLKNFIKCELNPGRFTNYSDFFGKAFDIFC